MMTFSLNGVNRTFDGDEEMPQARARAADHADADGVGAR